MDKLAIIEVLGVAESLPVALDKLTTKSTDGTGVFDSLMKVAKLHLAEEYEDGRITGEEYATVYLGLVTAILQQSIVFIANQSVEERTKAETGLARQKIVTELGQTSDSIPDDLGFNDANTFEGIILEQQELIAAQADTATNEKALMGQKVITELAQTDNTISDTAITIYGLNGDTTVEGIIASSIKKIDNEAILTAQKGITELAQTADAIPINTTGDFLNSGGVISPTVALDMAGVAGVQIPKIKAELVLLSQKAITELTQTCDTIPAQTADTYHLNNSASVEGVTLAQTNLFTKQTAGFDRDAEQKLLKIMADTWSVRATTTGADASDQNYFRDVDIGAIQRIAAVGIGDTEPEPNDS